MPIAVSEEHETLRRTVRRWLDTHCPPDVARAALSAAADELPPVWKALADQGWLGLAVPEADGGQGFGLVEVAVVLEELGWSLVPGPVLPTLLAASAVAAAAGPAGRAALLGGLVDGTTPAAVYLGAGTLAAVEGAEGSVVVDGTLRPVLGAPTARLVLAPLAGGGWCVLDTETDGVTVEAIEALDATRALGTIRATGAVVPPARRLGALDGATVRELAVVLAAAESAGGAAWCLTTASEYAKVRVQFGRPIGQFQAIKHKLADVYIAVELARSNAYYGAWALHTDAAELPIAASVARISACDAGWVASKENIQTHGGMGFTWQMDCQFYYRRAKLHALALGGTREWKRRLIAELRKSNTIALPTD